MLRRPVPELSRPEGIVRVLRPTGLAGAASVLALLAPIPSPAVVAQDTGARAVVSRAVERMGGAELLDRTGGLAFHATGWMDKTAERQGRGMEDDSRGPFVERIAVDATGATVAYEYREDRFDGTWEELREIYSGEDRRRIVVLSQGFTLDLRSPSHGAARRKLLRRIPSLLLAEVLADSLRSLDADGDTLRIAGALFDGTPLRLHFTRADTLLRRASYRMDYLSFGDTEVSWSWERYEEVDGLGMFPHRYRVTIADRPFTSMKVLRVRTGADGTAPLLRVPQGVEVREPQEIPPVTDASRNARVDTLGSGLYRVRNLRGGFHPLFVRMGDSLVVVDAPGGYPLPNEIPAGDVAPGPSSDWLSRRYLNLVGDAVPGVPVSHVVLTHFHNDHGGGLRAFVAEGARVVASAADTAEVRRFVAAPHTLAPDELSRNPAPLRMDAVGDRWVLDRAGRRLEVLEVGPNPHTRGMLVLRLPEEGVMFVSDLLDPTADPARFPTPSHAALDGWFGRWLAERDLAPERIYTMHGSGLATPEHLARLEGTALPSTEVEWIVRDEAVESGGVDASLVEPRLAVDPDDPEHLLVGVIVVDGDRDPWYCAVLTSFDGGRNWDRTDFDGTRRCIDPWVMVLGDGVAVATGLEILEGAEAPHRLRLVQHRSEDGGRTWTPEPDILGLGFDHPVLVPPRSEDGSLLLASRRGATASDGRLRHRISVGRLDPAAGAPGRFDEIASLLPAVVGLSVTGLAPLSDGSLIVTWWDVQREMDGFGPEGMLHRARAWASRSEDGGRTFGAPFLMGDHCASGGPEGDFPGYPYADLDRSDGPYSDRIYHACVRAGLDGVAVSASSDGGRRWSSPVRVDGGSPHARTPMLAVNRDGFVAVAWYDRRLDPEEACQDVYLSVSEDGGATFRTPLRVTTETSCPDVPGNEGVSGSWPMGGDYSSLAAGPDGSFHLVWADSRDGRFGLRRARFRVGAGF